MCPQARCHQSQHEKGNKIMNTCCLSSLLAYTVSCNTDHRHFWGTERCSGGATETVSFITGETFESQTLAEFHLKTSRPSVNFVSLHFKTYESKDRVLYMSWFFWGVGGRGWGGVGGELEWRGWLVEDGTLLLMENFSPRFLFLNMITRFWWFYTMRLLCTHFVFASDNKTKWWVWRQRGRSSLSPRALASFSLQFFWAAHSRRSCSHCLHRHIPFLQFYLFVLQKPETRQSCQFFAKSWRPQDVDEEVDTPAVELTELHIDSVI